MLLYTVGSCLAEGAPSMAFAKAASQFEGTYVVLRWLKDRHRKTSHQGPTYPELYMYKCGKKLRMYCHYLTSGPEAR